MKIMVSACLIGENCKYNGGNNYSEKVIKFIETADMIPGTKTEGIPGGKNEVIPVCPELAGGLSAPRPSCEMVNGRIMNTEGECRDKEFRDGAAKCLEIAMREKPDIVILQSRSPSCGVNQIYDGTFSGKLIKGSGVFAEMLMENGFNVIDVEDL